MLKCDFENKVAPTPSFMRGVQVGAMVIGALNTAVPGQFGVVDWPLWLRLSCAAVMLLAATHFVLQQRGFSLAARRSLP